MFDGWVMRLLFRLFWHWRTQAVEACTEYQDSSELFAYAGAICDSQSFVSSFPRQMLLLLRLMEYPLHGLIVTLAWVTARVFS